MTACRSQVNTGGTAAVEASVSRSDKRERHVRSPLPTAPRSPCLTSSHAFPRNVFRGWHCCRRHRCGASVPPACADKPTVLAHRRPKLKTNCQRTNRSRQTMPACRIPPLIEWLRHPSPTCQPSAPPNIGRKIRKTPLNPPLPSNRRSQGLIRVNDPHVSSLPDSKNRHWRKQYPPISMIITFLILSRSFWITFCFS